MIVKKIERMKNGELSIQWILTPEQQSFLCNFSLEWLLAKGLIHAANVTEEELKAMEEEMHADIAEQFLANLDKEDMGNA